MKMPNCTSCGSEPVRRSEIVGGTRYFFVICPRCGNVTHFKRNRQQAAKDWKKKNEDETV